MKFWIAGCACLMQTAKQLKILCVSHDWCRAHSLTFRFSSAVSSAALNIPHEEFQRTHWHFHHIYSLSFPDYFLEILWILLLRNVYLAWGVHIYNSSVLMPSNIIMLQHNRLAIYLCHCWSTRTQFIANLVKIIACINILIDI